MQSRHTRESAGRSAKSQVAKASPPVCNLYSLNKKRDMLARYFRVSHNRSAAFEPASAIFRGRVAPVVRQSAVTPVRLRGADAALLRADRPNAKASTDGGWQRRYDETLLRRLLFIRHARDLGFDVEDIRSLLDLAAKPNQPCASVDAIAKAHLKAIEDRIIRLTALRGELNRVLRACAKGRIAECKVIDTLTRHAERSL
jgi:DNA-binding transcriptional MerR regulator